MPKKDPPGGIDQKSQSNKPKGHKRNGPRYLVIKQPKDVMAYVQALVNQLRKEGSDVGELGKVSQLLNTWIAAYKAQMETNDFKKLREELDEWKAKMNEQ